MDWFVLPWKSLVVRGAIGIVIGLVTLVWPLATASALVLVLGLWALVDGLGVILAAARARGSLPRPALVGLVLIGVFSLVAGLLALTRPFDTAVALTWILGIWLLARAVGEVVSTFLGQISGPRWLPLVAAAASGLIGILLVANPGRAALALTVWLGVVILLWGAAFVTAGLLTRRLATQQADQSVPTG